MSRLLILAAGSLLLSGCAMQTAARTTGCVCPPEAGSWTAALRTADSLATAGMHAAADSVLADFAGRHPGTQASRETAFWRAFYRLDPQNPEGRRTEALAALDSYVQADSVWWYRAEARMLRQLAAIPAAPNGAAATRDPAELTAAEKDREIRALRERVARLNDELERIRRRLAAPTP